MINYELALKLKEAGFPQPEKPTLGHYNSWMLKNTFGVAYYKVEGQGEPTLIRLSPGMFYALESVYIPTLSELIEACGTLFSLISRGGDIKDRGIEMWEAYAKSKYGQGRTPEEAVANLWLATRV